MVQVLKEKVRHGLVGGFRFCVRRGDGVGLVLLEVLLSRKSFSERRELRSKMMLSHFKYQTIIYLVEREVFKNTIHVIFHQHLLLCYKIN